MALFLKVAKYKNGKTYLSIVDGYRDKNKKVKQSVIKKLGYLEDLKKYYDDPIAHFKNEVETLKKENRINIPSKLSIDENLEINTDVFLNLGYGFIKKIYQELNFKNFFLGKQKNLKINYELNKIFSLLVFSRILFPSSKKETFEKRNCFFEEYENFNLEDIYRSLDYFSNYKEEIETLIWNNTKNTYNRDTTHTYYDCTNYYFEINYNDTDLVDEEGNIIEKSYRKRGPEKNHRPDPIIEMGLLMDSNNIPLAYDLFPGNESEKLSLRPIHTRTKIKFNLERTIVVADRGLNTSDNIYSLVGDNSKEKNFDGYIYGQSIRGADKEFKEWVLDQNGYKVDKVVDIDGHVETFRKAIFNDQGQIVGYEQAEVEFKHKSRIYPKELTLKVGDKRNKKVRTDQKQLVYYSQKYADKQKRERNQIIERAKDLIKNPKKYNKLTAAGSAAYVNNLKFVKDTGEIANGLELSLNIKKIEEEEKYDGYYSIVTSELDMDDFELRKRYRGLSKIEESFKITKSELESRPVFVWTKEHIEAHFLTCFVSLIILRLLEQKLNYKYSIKKIINSLKNFGCTEEFSNIYMLFNNSEVIEELNNLYHTDITKKRISKSHIKKFLN